VGGWDLRTKWKMQALPIGAIFKKWRVRWNDPRISGSIEKDSRNQASDSQPPTNITRLNAKRATESGITTNKSGTSRTDQQIEHEKEDRIGI